MVVAGEVERHLLGRLEVEVVGVELPALRVLERVAGLDAEQRLVRARVLVAEVVDVAGRDEPEPGALGHLRKERVNSLLRLEVRVLHLDVGGVLAEDLDEPVHLRRSVGGPGLLERLADPSGEAAGERDQPLGVGLEQLPVDARLVVVTLEVAGRGELDQVGVAGVVLGEEREVSVPLGLGAAVVADVDLAAENRLDSDLSGLPVELDGPGKRAVIGEPDGGHLELSSPSRKGRDAARPVEDRVLGVDVKVDERRFRHGQPILVGWSASALERDQLRATIEECVTETDLSEFVMEVPDRQEFFKTKRPRLTSCQIRVGEGAIGIREQVAARLYDVRCRIVHAKETEDYPEAILPFTREADQLAHHDIELARFVARRVLIASSRPLSI